jgi:biopolymer transport protein ExbD
MRLAHGPAERPALPVMPLASLALLVLACLMISGMVATSRGPGLRFAGADRDERFDDSDAVRVEVISEQEALVEGVPVHLSDLAAAVSDRLTGRSDASVVLVVSPYATYETMVVAYGAISSLPGPPHIAFPLRRGIRG